MKTINTLLIAASLFAVSSQAATALPLSADEQLTHALERGKSRDKFSFTIYTNEHVRLSSINIAIRKAHEGARPRCKVNLVADKPSHYNCKYQMLVPNKWGWLDVMKKRRVITIMPYIKIADRSKLVGVSEQ